LLFHKHLEALVSGDVFLDRRQLVARDVFGYVATVLAMLEVVVRLAVRARADDGEMAALHRGDRDHLFDAFGKLINLHGLTVYSEPYTLPQKNTGGSWISCFRT